ncbi:MAG: signal peptidase II [Micrococcaceae bacterium]
MSSQRLKPLGSYMLVFLVVFFLDFFSKQAIIASLQEGQSKDIIGQFLKFTYVRNPGAAFSMGIDMTWVFSLIALIAVIGITTFVFLKVKCRWWLVCLGLIAGGAAGNLLDRLVRPPGFLHGYVVDFIQLPHYAIFNVADSAIVVGAIIAVVLVFKEVDYAKTSK